MGSYGVIWGYMGLYGHPIQLYRQPIWLYGVMGLVAAVKGYGDRGYGVSGL